jgi:hypothetical protein
MGKRFKSKGMGFICIGQDDRFYFFDKDTRTIVSANISRGEYLPNRIARLKGKFPLNYGIREELAAAILKRQLP